MCTHTGYTLSGGFNVELKVKSIYCFSPPNGISQVDERKNISQRSTASRGGKANDGRRPKLIDSPSQLATAAMA